MAWHTCIVTLFFSACANSNKLLKEHVLAFQMYHHLWCLHHCQNLHHSLSQVPAGLCKWSHWSSSYCYFDSYVDTMGICVWLFLLILRSMREYIPTVPKKHTSQWFSWRLECWNICYSLRILESCTEHGHLANGNAVHNPHVSISYELQKRHMTLI